jgi:hypothetical protein
MKQQGFILMTVLCCISLLATLLIMSYQHVFGGLKLAQLKHQGIRLRREESEKLLMIKNSESIQTGCLPLQKQPHGGRRVCLWGSSQGSNLKQIPQRMVQEKAALNSRILVTLPRYTKQFDCVGSQDSLFETRAIRSLSDESLVSASLCLELPDTGESLLILQGNLSTSRLKIPTTLRTLIVSGYLESQEIEIAGDLTLLIGGDVLIASYTSLHPQHIAIISMTGRIEAGQVSPTIHTTFVGYHDSTIQAPLSSSQRQLLKPLSHLIHGLIDTSY